MRRLAYALSVAAAVLLAGIATPTAALAMEDDSGEGTFTGFDPASGQQIASRDERPPMDPVGGFQVSLVGGVQLRGTASGQGGIALGYYKRSTGNVGVEIEGGFTSGPGGRIYHGLLSLVLQSGTRATRMIPYVTLGAGAFRAEEDLRDRLAEALPEFGIDPTGETETGALVAFGFGIRYYLSDSVSFRADYREFRALTTGEGSFFDRLFALRRIGGFLSFDL